MSKTTQSLLSPITEEEKEKRKRPPKRAVEDYTPKYEVKTTRILSMGAGVNTVAMLLKYGKMGRWDYCVFADTGAEVQATYDYIEKYLKPFCKECNLPWITVRHLSGLNIWDYYMCKETLPMKVTRECTRAFKIEPINRFARSQGATEQNPMITELGITSDEEWRAKMNKADKKYILKRWPFCHEDPTSRRGCYEIIKDAGWPPPIKSGCDFCMFKPRSWFHKLAAERPERFAELIQLEKNDTRYPKFPLDGRALMQNILDNAVLDAATITDDDFAQGCKDGYCGV